jgi:hypothetical protein
MDVLYYSNYCKHSSNILQFVTQNNLNNKLNFICIDKRAKDPQTGAIFIVLESGERIPMPPNIHSVPALLLVKQSYNVVLGNNIIEHLKPMVANQNDFATSSNGEPVGYDLNSFTGNSNIISERYTDYNLSPEELSAKGKGPNRQLYNYVSVNQSTFHLETPEDTYRPDKLGSGITIEELQNKRNQDLR